MYHKSQKVMAIAQSGIGPALRNERTRQQLSLDDVAQGTRISQRFLKAIESGDMASLPGIVFARNFVRQYAVFLKLDPEPLLTGMPRFDIDSAPLPNPPAKVAESRWTSWMTPGASVAVWCVLAATAAAGGWWYFELPRTPATSATATPAAKQPTTPPVDAQATAPVADLAQIPVPPPGQTADRPQDPANVQPAADSASQQTPGPVVQNAHDSAKAVQVVLTARESSWVQVTADGRTAFVGMLKPNDSRSIAADSLVKVIAGNAGGLQISLNGKALDPIGQVGQVRTVRLTAEGPEFVQRIRPEQGPL